MIPAPALIPHAVNENVSFLLGISPLPIVKFQAIMNEIACSRFQIHKLFFVTFLLPSRNCYRFSRRLIRLWRSLLPFRPRPPTRRLIYPESEVYLA